MIGTFSTHNIFVQAGISPIETIQVEDNPGLTLIGPDTGITAATCPASHPFLIGGSYALSHDGDGVVAVNPFFETDTNTYTVLVSHNGPGSMVVIAKALCANFNFPMNMGGMIGGELLDINTVSMFIGAVGVNPVITGLVGITLAGIAGQIGWTLYKRRK